MQAGEKVQMIFDAVDTVKTTLAGLMIPRSYRLERTAYNSGFSGECVAFPLSDTTTPKGNLTTPSLPSTFPAAQRASLLGTGLVQFFTPPDHDPMVRDVEP